MELPFHPAPGNKSNTNKIKIQCVCGFHSLGICHDAQSYDLKNAYRCLCTYMISFVITLLHRVNIGLCHLAEEGVSVKNY